jgi:hypothetical protein
MTLRNWLKCTATVVLEQPVGSEALDFSGTYTLAILALHMPV